MKIEKALKLRVGQQVNYPADRGSPPGTGNISHVGTQVHKNIHGREYIWVTVKGGGVWPSNRLVG